MWAPSACAFGLNFTLVGIVIASFGVGGLVYAAS